MVRTALQGFLVAFTMMLLGPALVGFSPANAATVSRIEVRGTERVDAETVKAYLLIQPGQSFTAADVDESLKALFETGLFADASVVQSGGTLVVTVQENPIINTVAFEGNKKFKDNQLEPSIQSKPRGVFTRAKVQNDVQRILEMYRRSGRFQASVEPKVIELSSNRVNLVFEIAEGPNTGVASINFIGNQAYGDRRLRNVISTQESGFLSFLRTGDNYDPDRLAADEEKLRRFYLDHGYADFQVVSSVADLDRERNSFFITFSVMENQNYRFGTIAVDSTIPGVDGASLQRLATTDEGDTFSSTKVDESMEAMTLELAGSGYAFAQVRPRFDRNPETLTVGVTYVVDEGSRTYIERIEVRGNSRTRDYVIRREFDIAEGDAFNRVLVDRAERRLNALGYFTVVGITTEPGTAPDRVVVVVNVEEQPTGEFSFGAGYSTNDGIVGDVSLTERNFLGRGYAVRTAVGGGTNSRTYEFGITDPYFLGRRISAGFNVYRRTYNESDYRAYDFETTGGGITFGLPITENFTVQLGYQLELQNIEIDNNTFDEDNPIATCPANISNAICQAAGESYTSSILYSLIYDTLDNRRDPRDGIYAKFTQEFAGVGGDVSFLRTTGSATYYRELLPEADVFGFLKVQGGHIMGVGEDVRLIDAFFKGPDLVRGFKTSGMGPRDGTTGDALGGNIFVGGTAEVQFPLPMIPKEIGFRGAVFADAGTLFDTDAGNITGVVVAADDATIRSSVGASLLWASPLGPLRADFAYVLTKDDQDEEQFFRIGGGSKF